MFQEVCPLPADMQLVPPESRPVTLAAQDVLAGAKSLVEVCSEYSSWLHSLCAGRQSFVFKRKQKSR